MQARQSISAYTLQPVIQIQKNRSVRRRGGRDYDMMMLMF
jgi:hypothetical protein